MTNDNIFSGLKVVDFSSFVAGPAAAVILSDFGADVIKVEPPSGDPWRHGHQVAPQPLAKDPYQFHLSNRNKRGLTLDLTRPEAKTAPAPRPLGAGTMDKEGTSWDFKFQPLSMRHARLVIHDKNAEKGAPRTILRRLLR